MTNKQKRITAMIAMIAVILCVSILSLPFFHSTMLFFGGWQVGTWVGEWARSMWPDPVPRDTPPDDSNTFEG